MPDADTTTQFSREGDGPQPGRTLDDLFGLVESLRGEFAEFRERVEIRLLGTTPLSEMIDAIRADVGIVAERQNAFGKEVAEIAKAVTELTKATSEIAKGSRRIESKVNGIAIDFAELKGILHDHEVRLQALDSR